MRRRDCGQIGNWQHSTSLPDDHRQTAGLNIELQLAVFDGYAVRCSFLCLECKFLVAVEDVARCAVARLYYSLNELALFPNDVEFKTALCA